MSKCHYFTLWFYFYVVWVEFLLWSDTLLTVLYTLVMTFFIRWNSRLGSCRPSSSHLLLSRRHRHVCWVTCFILGRIVSNIMFRHSAEITSFFICCSPVRSISEAVLSEVKHCCTEKMYNETRILSQTPHSWFLIWSTPTSSLREDVKLM